MTRDELLLAGMAAGETTTAALVRATGVTERTCRYGLSHLIAIGYAWSPERGRWRLTEAGRAIATTLPSLPAAEPPGAESIALADDDGDTVISPDPEEPASLWWTLAGIAAAVVLALARRSATMPPPAPPPAPPTIWPYDGWRI